MALAPLMVPARVELVLAAEAQVEMDRVMVAWAVAEVSAAALAAEVLGGSVIATDVTPGLGPHKFSAALFGHSLLSARYYAVGERLEYFSWQHVHLRARHTSLPHRAMTVLFHFTIAWATGTIILLLMLVSHQFL